MKNLSSIELSDIKKCDLGQIDIVIKKLKISSGEFIRIPFSFINNLEELDLNETTLDIYDLPNNKNFIELTNLKCLSLSNSRVSKVLNIEISTPNLTDLSIYEYGEDPYYSEIEENLLFLFDPYSKDNFYIDSIYDDINHYFFKFVHLNELSLWFDIDVENKGDTIKNVFGV